MRRRVLGEEHPDTLTSAGNLASSLWGLGKYAQAERVEREVLGVKRRVLGEEHPETLMSASNLASSLSDQGKHAEAEQILKPGGACQWCVLRHYELVRLPESRPYMTSSWQLKSGQGD